MEVTDGNIIEKLPFIREIIENCDFFAIDCEMTGIYFTKPEDFSDSLNGRILKSIQGSSKYSIIQIGICPVKYDSVTDIHEFYPLCFPIFPRNFIGFYPMKQISCLTSSISFLSSHNFDFNKWISSGVSFVRLNEEKTLINKYKSVLDEIDERLADLSKNEAVENIYVDLPKSPVAIELCEKVVEFYVNNEESKILKLEPCDNAVRASVYIYLNSRYGKNIIIKSNKNEKNERYLSIEKPSLIDLINSLKDKKENIQKKFESYIAFTTVLKLLIDSKKPLVGHNMFMDLIMIFNQLIEPLPPFFCDLKQKVSMYFTKIFDTKVISSCGNFTECIQNTSLGPLFEQIKNSTQLIRANIKINEKCNRYELSNQQCHDAGYDAFMTSYCFLNLILNLYKEKLLNYKSIDFSSESLNILVNKINLINLHCSKLLDLNMDSQYPNDLDQKILYKIEHNKKLISENIVELFASFCDIKVYHINSQLSYVVLLNDENCDLIYKQLCDEEISNTNDIIRKFEIKISRQDDVNISSCSSKNNNNSMNQISESFNENIKRSKLND